jgi:hypothetical protein
MPAAAVADVVPESVHADVKVITSMAPVPDVMGILLLSSIETANEGSTVPATAVNAG